MKTVYLYGLKAAPLTKAHSKIIYNHLKIVANEKDSYFLITVAPFKDDKLFGITQKDRVELVENFVDRAIDNIAPLDHSLYRQQHHLDDFGNVEVIAQSDWNGLYKWATEKIYAIKNAEKVVLIVGTDELTDIQENRWDDSDKIKENWELKEIERSSNNLISATALRKMLYRDPDVDYFYVQHFIEKSVFDDIKTHGWFRQLKPDYRAEENIFIENYDSSPFKKPSVTVDNIVWRKSKKNAANDIEILLVRRGGHPYKGFWAFPGGFLDIDKDKTLEKAAERELEEETGISKFDTVEWVYGKSWMQQVKTYGNMGTDPRMRIVDVVFESEVRDDIEPEAGDDATEFCWFSENDLPRLAFNHRQILDEWKEIRKNRTKILDKDV